MEFGAAVKAAEMTFRRTQNTSDTADDTLVAARMKSLEGLALSRPLMMFSSDPLKANNQIRKAVRDAASDPARLGRTSAAITMNTALSASVGTMFVGGVISFLILMMTKTRS